MPPHARHDSQRSEPEARENGSYPGFANDIIERRTSRRYSLLMSAAVCLGLISVFIHARGALTYDTWDWNSIPSNIDEHPARLWDWHDVQFLRGIGSGR